MTEIAELRQQVRTLTSAIIAMSRTQGTRLSRTELAYRLDVHPNTITRWLQEDNNFPRPDKTNKWRLADILKWEDAQTAPLAGPVFQQDGQPTG